MNYYCQCWNWNNLTPALLIIFYPGATTKPQTLDFTHQLFGFGKTNSVACVWLVSILCCGVVQHVMWKLTKISLDFVTTALWVLYIFRIHLLIANVQSTKCIIMQMIRKSVSVGQKLLKLVWLYPLCWLTMLCHFRFMKNSVNAVNCEK